MALADFARGAGYVPRGFRRLLEPGLRSYVWLPLLINVVVFTALFWGGTEAFGSLLDWLLPAPSEVSGEGWWAATKAFLLEAARWLLWPLFLLAAAVVMFYTFTAVANLLASPFNGMLAARVEERAGGRLPPGAAAGGMVVEVAGALRDELRKMLHFALLALPLVVLSLVPVLNVAAPLLWLLYGAWVLALEYMDYPLGNHGVTFPEQRRQLRRRRLLFLGFGAGVLAMTLVPGLNLLAMPTAVIAAAMLHAEEGGQLQN